MSAPGRDRRGVLFSDKQHLAAREILRYAATAARALEHVAAVSHECKMIRSTEAVRRCMGEARALERIARAQLSDLEEPAPSLLEGGAE